MPHHRRPYRKAALKGGTPLQDWMSLALSNRHPRDNEIVFDEPTHVYTVKGNSRGWISVTKLLHAFFPEFNPDQVIESMMKSPNWPQSKYYGMTPAAIKAQWNANGREASGAGTDIHLGIEMVMNGALDRVEPRIRASPEWAYFESYWKQDSQVWEPWRTEWEVWDEDLKLAGSIDMVYRNKADGTFAVYDWKRAKDMKMNNDYETGLGPCEVLPNCNYSKYSLQLNVYRWMLQRHYGLVINSLCLVVLHPSNESFRCYPVPILDDLTEKVIQCRRQALAEGRGHYVSFPGMIEHHTQLQPQQPAPPISQKSAVYMFQDDS